MDYIRIQPRVAYHANMEGYYNCVVLLMVQGNNEVAEFLDGFMKRYGEFVLQKEFEVFTTAHRLNQRFLYEGNEVQDLVYPVELGTCKVDDEDKAIMNILSTNARTSITEIAKQAKIAPKSVAYRIRRLEKENIILGYVSSPNFEKIGLKFYQLNISLKDRSIATESIAYFNATNKCLFAIESIGRYDLVIEVHLKGERELKEIMDGFREKFAGKYADCDVSTIYQEYVVVWSPFAWKKE
ncbi:MAG: Lrp/AsnC family transcriptional regulator, partial [Candidatus Micrarchaeia archaeon]